jgi:serine/threonine protein kinase
VYLVRHKLERKHYVMKVIKLKGIPKKERDACRNEVALLQRLNHPNIVAYKESFLAKDSEQLSIVMTFCDGGDLGDRVARQKGKLFSEDQVLHWFVQVRWAGARVRCVRAGVVCPCPARHIRDARVPPPPDCARPALHARQ